MQKGNKAFLAYILDTRDSKSKLEQLPVVNSLLMFFLRNCQVYHLIVKLSL